MILAPAVLTVAYFNSQASIAYIFSEYSPCMNLLSGELAPVSGDRGAEVMPLFDKCGLVICARCLIIHK